MESLNELKAYGESLGYQDEELRKFIQDQQAIFRDERAAARQKEKDDMVFQLEMEKEKLEMEKERNVIERERLEHQFKLEQQELHHKQQLELLHQKAVDTKPPEKSASSNVQKFPKIPPFEDGKDDMDSYLRRFERYADAQKWSKTTWATHLSALLKGRALDVYALLPSEHALDYDFLKMALLRRYDLTEDGFKRKFISCRPDPGETFLQFSVRLDSYLQRWVEMSKIDKTFQGLADLILRDQFLYVCNRDLSLFIKERIPKSIDEMSTLADQFREARFTNAASLVSKSGPIQTSVHKGQGQGPPSLSSIPKSDFVKHPDQNKNRFVPKSERRCYKCHQIGHIASECHPKHKIGCVVSESVDSEIEGTVCEETFVKGCSAFIAPIDSIVNTQASSSSDPSIRLTSACQSSICGNMPVSSGYVEGNLVTVLRDTGCSGIVVRRSKILDQNLTEKFQPCLLANGSTINAPIARITIDTPYLSGTYEAWCMESPVYDLIVGNVDNVREPGKPDPDWKPVQTVETIEEADDQQAGEQISLDSVTTPQPDNSQGLLSMVNSVVIDCSTN